MTPSKIFEISNSLALIGWLLLIIAPTWKYTKIIIQYGLLLLFAGLYAFFVIKDIGNFKPDSFSTLENVKALFQNDSAVAMGWLHYLCFDLLVGTYIVEKCEKAKISRWLYTIALPFTFMFGPLGYLIFRIIYFLKTKDGIPL